MPNAAATEYLSIRVQPYDEWNRELVVAASANGFAGRGSAYFAVDALRQFAAELSRYPLPTEPAVVTGGYVDQEHVGLRVRRAGPLGQLSIEVHLASPDWTRGRPELDHEVRLALLTTYQRLGRFALQLARSVDDGGIEARIDGERLAST